MAFFIEIKQTILKFVWKYKRSQIAIAIVRKKNNAEGIVLSDFKQNWKAMSIKIVWYWLKNRHIDQWNRIEISEINPQIFSQLLYDKVPRIYIGERIVSSINVIGKTEKTKCKSMKRDAYIVHMQK